jgi:hypothetical protein
MADDDEFDLDENGEEQVLNPNIRRELREGRKERQRLEDELNRTKREAAFARAGIDDTTPLGRMFVKSYEGDVSLEAIKTAAEEIPGLVAPPPPDPNAMSADELDAQRRMAGASGGSGAGGPDLQSEFDAELAEVLRTHTGIKGGERGGIEAVMNVVDKYGGTLGVVRKGAQ